MRYSIEMRVPTPRLVMPYSYAYTPISRCEDQWKVQHWNERIKLQENIFDILAYIISKNIHGKRCT